MAPRIPGPRPGGDHNLLDLFLPQLQGYVENLPILGDLVEAITGREDGDPNDIGSMINNLKAWVGGLFGFRASISSQVKELQGLIATGAQFYDSFDRGDADLLGNGWSQGGDGQPLGIRDQAALVIVGGLIAQPGRRWAKSPQAATGDTFAVSMVTHPIAPSQYAETWLLARMNDAFTQGLALRMVSGRCFLSRVSRSGNGWSVTDIAQNLSKSYSKSATVEFKGEESVLQVSIDSVIVMTATDTVHSVGAAFRFNGFAEQTTTVAGGFAPSYSGGLASYSLKSVAALDSVVNTATTVAVAKVAPVSSAVTAGASGAAIPAGADPTVYAATAALSASATAASSTATAAQTQAAASVATQNAATALGVSASVLFSGPDGGVLPTVDFTDDGSGNVVVRAPYGYAGIKAGAADGVYGARLNTVTVTDHQSVTIVVGDSANVNEKTRILARCDAGLTRGAFLEIADNSTVKLGRWTRSGSSWDFSTVWSSAAADVNQGQRVELRAVLSTYVALVDGIPVVSYSDTAVSLTTGVDFRYVGFAMQRQTISGNTGFPFFTPTTTVYDSYRVASLSFSDYKVPGAVVGIGWKLFRSSSSAVNLPGQAVNFYPVVTDVYDSQAGVSQVTLTNLARGLITIQRSGYYQITGSMAGLSVATTFVLYLNGGRATAAINPDTPTFLYLDSGDTLQIGYTRTSTAAGTFEGGSPSGGSLHFSGFLMQTAN